MTLKIIMGGMNGVMLECSGEPEDVKAEADRFYSALENAAKNNAMLAAVLRARSLLGESAWGR